MLRILTIGLTITTGLLAIAFLASVTRYKKGSLTQANLEKTSLFYFKHKLTARQIIMYGWLLNSLFIFGLAILFLYILLFII